MTPAHDHPRSRQAFTIDSSVSAPSLQIECIWKSPRYLARDGDPLRDRTSLDRRAAEILPAQVVQARNLLLLARLPHGALDERAVAVDESARARCGPWSARCRRSP